MEISASWHETVDDWCADVLSTVTSALLQGYTLTEYRRDGRLVRTRLTSDDPQFAGSVVAAGSWTGLLPLRRRRLDVTTRYVSYGCRGSLP